MCAFEPWLRLGEVSERYATDARQPHEHQGNTTQVNNDRNIIVVRIGLLNSFRKETTRKRSHEDHRRHDAARAAHGEWIYIITPHWLRLVSAIPVGWYPSVAAWDSGIPGDFLVHEETPRLVMEQRDIISTLTATANAKDLGNSIPHSLPSLALPDGIRQPCRDSP